MDRFSLVILRAAAVSLCLAAAACSGRGTGYIPEAPDYSDRTFWYVEENDSTGTGADVFYVVSTWESDWTADNGQVCHYADVHRAGHRRNMATEMKSIAEYMGKGNNFYSPYYRHITIEGWATLDEEVIADRFSTAFQDIREAFCTFLQHRDPSRPLVLAGFSQGGKGVVELLKVMPEDVYGKLVAAYVLGYKVTPADTLASDNIRGAECADDLGVTVCYNSVSDLKFIQPVIAAPCAFCINPVNWRTDSTPAVLHDTITVRLAPEENVLVLTGYSGSEYPPILGFLNVGDFHCCEPFLYRECLEQNIQDRIAAFRKRESLVPVTR